MKLEYLPDGPNDFGLIGYSTTVRPRFENCASLQASWPLVPENESPLTKGVGLPRWKVAN